ncbi:M14 family zinc carboxypeptidase [Sporosarcina sp. E16_8]|uniref:M14 family zinc carboxypeptidase n=1 Tax=Sporosarcina sp. E16_8 TaxID=2789295 RepID=UPI001A91650F|nr:M14 family zinc carboxypeptidase [Sporosarcina sp. E16_8]MBO0589246.1 carboxypeptidase [Sporosarcina sp. E16_8]
MKRKRVNRCRSSAPSFYESASVTSNVPIVNENQHIKTECLTNYEEMSSFLEKVDREAEHITVEVIGESVKGRDLYLAKFGHNLNDANTPTLLILTQQHGNESLVTESAINVLRQLSTNNKEVRDLLDKVNILFVPRLNVDGAEGDVDWDTSHFHHGGLQTRNNANGINLNRTHNSLSQPESKALHENVLDKYKIDYAIDFHHQIANRATDDGEFVSGAMLYPTNNDVTDEVLESSKKLGAVVYDAVEPKGYSNLAYYRSDSTQTSIARNHFAVHYDIPTLLFENRGLTDSPNPSSILGQKGNGDLINQGEVAMMAAIRAIANGSIKDAHISVWNYLPEQHTIEDD